MDSTFIWQLALRYLRGKRSGNAAPVLSRISMVAVAVSSAAMIVAFSVFNGLSDIWEANYIAFYPDVKITVVRGKFFQLDTGVITNISRVPGVKTMCRVIEDNVLINGHEQQKTITVKGIENDYFDVSDVRERITNGDDTVSAALATTIVGTHIMDQLGVDVNTLTYIDINYPNPTATNIMADPLSAIGSLKLNPSGVFEIAEFDDKYILAPMKLIQELFHATGRYSSVELKAEPGSADRVKEQLKQMLGSKYKVETRYEQNKTLYMVMNAERWAVYAILLLVMLIASFNMVGALSMLVLEKQKDIAILKTMGAQPGAIRTIFLIEGVLWSLIGGIAGLLLGSTICLLQIRFGLLKMGEGFLVENFPVKMQGGDFVVVILTIIAVGLLTSWYPAVRANQAVDPSLKST